MRRAVFVLAALLALLGALTWWGLTAVEQVVRDSRETAEAEAPGQDAVTLRGAAPPPAGAEQEAGGGTRPAQGAGEAFPWAGTLRVEGADGVTSFDPPVRVVLRPHRPGRAGVDAGFEFEVAAPVRTGPFRFDLGPLFQRTENVFGPGALWIRADHPRYGMPAVKVPFPGEARVRAGTATLPPLDLVLRRQGRVRGVVRGMDGTYVSGSTVLLYAMSPDGPEPVPVASQVTVLGARFSLPFSREGRYLLVATETVADGLGSLNVVPWSAPAWEIVDLALEGPEKRVDLRVREGHALAGRVRVAGETRRGTELAWRFAGEATRLALGRGDETIAALGGLVYADGAVHWGWGEMYVPDDGDFELRGLPPLPYRVAVKGAPGVHVHPRATGGVVQVATPPRRGVDFDLRFAHVGIEVRRDGMPLAGTRVEVAAIGMDPDLPEGVVWWTWFHETDQRGRLLLPVSPACTYAASLGDERFEPAYETFTAPAAGEALELLIEAVPTAPGARLRVRFAGEGAGELTSASFGFYGGDRRFVDTTAWPVVTAKVEDGVCVLDGLPAGPFRVRARPGRAWHAVPDAWADASFEAVLRAGEETTVDVPLARGGRLQIAVTDAHGRPLEAACWLTGPDGAPVPVWFRGEDGSGGLRRSPLSLPGTGPAWVESVLPAGEYVVSLELEDHRPEQRRVTLRAGEPTALNVVLRPLR